VALMNKRLIFLGGGNIYGTDNSCFYLDLETLKRSSIAPMKIARYEHGAAVVKGHLYAVGGEGQYGEDDYGDGIEYDLDSVERFE